MQNNYLKTLSIAKRGYYMFSKSVLNLLNRRLRLSTNKFVGRIKTNCLKEWKRYFKKKNLETNKSHFQTTEVYKKICWIKMITVSKLLLLTFRCALGKSSYLPYGGPGFDARRDLNFLRFFSLFYARVFIAFTRRTVVNEPIHFGFRSNAEFVKIKQERKRL